MFLTVLSAPADCLFSTLERPSPLLWVVPLMLLTVPDDPLEGPLPLVLPLPVPLLLALALGILLDGVEVA